MSRTKGSQNADFDSKRSDLLARLRSAILSPSAPTSFRGLAEACGVTMPTLKHYFGDREAVIAAVFADCHLGGIEQLKIAATPTGAFRRSIKDLVQHVIAGFQHGKLTELHAIGITLGVEHSLLAKAYLASVLEPTIVAIQQRLEAHATRGEMRKVDNRIAAISLVSPLLVLFLHQDALCGKAAYPIDLNAFATQHAQMFITAYELKPRSSEK